ncbi:MAG: hypothetical protein IJK01_06075 [Clostridia bacterium]|nr:hypothetical protein [Clostridia bacterium]
MKKRALYVAILLVILLSMTACIRFDATVKINANGTADVSMLIAASDALSSMGDGESQSFGLSDEEIAEYKAKGFTYEEYVDVDAGYTGYTLSRKGVDLKSDNNTTDETGMESILDGDMFTVNGRHVVIDFAPFSESEYEESGSYFSLLKNYGGYMKFNLELPVKPTSHNATTASEDGKTLTWDLTKLGAKDTVHAEFDMPSASILIWLLPVIGVLVIAAVVVIILMKKKKASSVNSFEVNDMTDTATDKIEE